MNSRQTGPIQDLLNNRGIGNLVLPNVGEF